MIAPVDTTCPTIELRPGELCEDLESEHSRVRRIESDIADTLVRRCLPTPEPPPPALSRRQLDAVCDLLETAVAILRGDIEADEPDELEDRPTRPGVPPPDEPGAGWWTTTAQDANGGPRRAPGTTNAPSCDHPAHLGRPGASGEVSRIQTEMGHQPPNGGVQ